ncbi:uncharacterized protein isoform X3 [Bombus fervidus]|uniref:uncharacterized protein isoform X3 n=1 Tax=Bombus fervidus TaxID=203811 RepID=UPI003D18DA2C
MRVPSYEEAGAKRSRPSDSRIKWIKWYHSGTHGHRRTECHKRIKSEQEQNVPNPGGNRPAASSKVSCFKCHEEGMLRLIVRYCEKETPIPKGRPRCPFIFDIYMSCVRRRGGCGVPSARHGVLRYVRIIQHAYTSSIWFDILPRDYLGHHAVRRDLRQVYIFNFIKHASIFYYH